MKNILVLLLILVFVYIPLTMCKQPEVKVKEITSPCKELLYQRRIVLFTTPNGSQSKQEQLEKIDYQISKLCPCDSLNNK